LKGEQEYCDDPECQRARKAAWQKEKKVKDLEYRARQIECLKRWRESRPLHQYQREYRENHPDYVARNREQQRIRNRKRRTQPDSTEDKKIVKMDALPGRPILSGTYALTPWEVDASRKVVKMDALIVELAVLQGDMPQVIP
jgi:hypothetical protein